MTESHSTGMRHTRSLYHKIGACDMHGHGTWNGFIENQLALCSGTLIHFHDLCPLDTSMPLVCHKINDFEFAVSTTFVLLHPWVCLLFLSNFGLQLGKLIVRPYPIWCFVWCLFCCYCCCFVWRLNILPHICKFVGAVQCCTCAMCSVFHNCMYM